jgi:type VI secretion system protein VasJ
VTEQKFATLIPEVEESFAKSPFWLDAHRLTAVALENLGPAYAAAKAVVISELASFLRRLPELPTFKFADGTPFANEQTRLWIEQEVLTGGGAGGAPSTAAGGESEAAPWLAGQAQAKQLAVKGKLAEALDLLRAGAQQSQSQRERFGWELAQAKFCIDAGMQQVALPQLEHLDRQTEKFALDDWEPVLSLEVARLLLLCYAQSAEKNKKLKEAYAPKAESLYARICRLDINAALKLDMKAFQ